MENSELMENTELMENSELTLPNIKDNWIDDFEKEDELYKNFYKEMQPEIEIVFSYIDKKNDIIAVKKEKTRLDNNILKKELLIHLLNDKMIFNGLKYRPISLLKWNINLDAENITEYLNNKIDEYNESFLNIEREIKDITFDESIIFLQDINRLYIFFHESWDAYNNRTKKIHVKTSSKLKNKKQSKRLKK
tara:strand:- start:944 stop:1519 length:576 start_codon:yes stop_codon:yes gene_type:complete